MGLVKCPDCGNMVSERAAACPSCGCPADAFVSGSDDLSNNISVVHQVEVKPTSIIDDRFRNSDGSLDDTHNVFSPNYRQEEKTNVEVKPTSIIDDRFRNSDGSLDDTHNVFSPNYRQEEKTNYDSIISSTIAYPLLKFFDRKDLMLANDCVIKELQKELSVDRPITFFSVENPSVASKVTACEFEFPYVTVISSFRYILDYRKFTLHRADGSSYERYYDLKTLPSQYAPKIEVISDNENEVKEIIEQIKTIFKDTKSYSVPFLGGSDENLTFSCEIESIERVKEIRDEDQTRLVYKEVVFKRNPWATYIDDDINPNQNEKTRIFRNTQLAQFYLLYYLMKDKCSNEIKLYEKLRVSVGMFGALFVPASTEEYKLLKANIQYGRAYEAEQVEKAFPTISLMYHNLPSDVENRTPANDIKSSVEEILNQYKIRWEKTCVDLNIPTDFVVSGQNVSMRSKAGLNRILVELEKNIMRSIDDIVDETKTEIEVKVAEQRAREQYEQQYEQYEPAPQSTNGGGAGILSGALKTAAGVAIGNRISENSKRKDFMGSSQCIIGKKDKYGFTQSCNWTCPLWRECVRGR